MRSLRRIRAIAGTTFTELARLRVFYVLILFGLVLIISSTFIARISFQQELQVTKDISLGAINFFVALLAIVATAQLLPRDLEDRVVYSVLAKPVRRYEYILGKFFGVVGLLAITLVAMSALCLAVLKLREQSALQDLQQQTAALTPEQASASLHAIQDAVASGTLLRAIGFMFLKGAVLVALTLCVSTFATSGIFTICAMAMVYLIGHLESVARDYWLSRHEASALTHFFIGLVAFVFPDLQAFNLSDQIVAGAILSAGFLLKLLGLGIFYIVIYLLLAIALFYRREL